MPEQSLFDPAALARIESIKPGLAAKVLGLFLDNAPSRYAVFRDGMAAGDWTAVSGAAHSLKSSAGNLGAGLLMDVCLRLETAAEGGEGRVPAELSAEFESVYARTVSALSEERNAWPASGR